MSRLRRYTLPTVLSLLICAAMWPSLGWVGLSNGSEQLVVAAALESQRDGSWQRRMVPTMNGEPRLRKPPLTTWAAMAAVPTPMARDLADGPVDDEAYRSATIRIRTVSLVLGLALLVFTFELGRVLGGRELGLISLAVCGSTYFFLEQYIRLTTDAMLATFVVGANVALAHALLKGRLWAGMIGAGIGVGLAFFAKGPVALIQTVLPALLLIPFLPRSQRRTLWTRQALGGSGLALLLFLLIALPWFAYVLITEPNAWQVWAMEVGRTDESVPPGKPWAYISLLVLVVPWTPFLVLGLVTATAELFRRLGGGRVRWLPRGRALARMRGPGMIYALLMVIVPIAIMLLVRDKKDRYLLPMLAPTCILVAEALRLVIADARRRPKGAAAVFAIHYAILFVFCVGMPVATMLLPRHEGVDAAPWLSPEIAVPMLLLGLVLWVLALLLKRRFGTAGLVTGTVVCVLFTANVFLAGQGQSREGKSDLKPLAEVIRREVPEATLWYDGAELRPDLLIYAGDVFLPLEDLDTTNFDRSRPNVFVVRQHHAERDPEPTMPPPWEVLTTAARDPSLWWAFVLPATE